MACLIVNGQSNARSNVHENGHVHVDVKLTEPDYCISGNKGNRASLRATGGSVDSMCATPPGFCPANWANRISASK
jgi:hypothetical protein